MASVAFFLTNRKAMNLVPLANVKLGDSATERFYILVKKGKYSSLTQLKGKILSGSILYEGSSFLDKVVFNNTLRASTHFKLKPTGRPLSAVRRMVRNRVDAVIVNEIQYQALKGISLGSKVSVIHTSPTMPALGLMMTDTPGTRALQPKVVAAITEMCSDAQGAKECRNFGIKGFVPVRSGALDGVIGLYER